MAELGATLSDRLNPTHPAFDADLKRRWGTMPKSERKAIIEADRQAIAARHASVADIRHPFETEDDDHCETGAECFSDVAPLLAQYAAYLRRNEGSQGEDDQDGSGDDEEDIGDDLRGKAMASLKIYDPYYCTGAVVRHLGNLGFRDVYNRCEDFYKVAAAGRTPEFDVLLTNPAYSGDHIPRLLEFVEREVVAKDRAFALLMPSYVCSKDYWTRFVEKKLHNAVAFLCPQKRYVYWTPAGLRSKKQAHSSALGNRTSPFVTFWYLHFGKHHNRILDWWQKQVKQNRKAGKKGAPKASGTLPDCMLARSVNALPKGVRPAMPVRKRSRDTEAEEERNRDDGDHKQAGERQSDDGSRKRPRTSKEAPRGRDFQNRGGRGGARGRGVSKTNPSTISTPAPRGRHTKFE